MSGMLMLGDSTFEAVALVDISRSQRFRQKTPVIRFPFVQEKLNKALEEVSVLPLDGGSELRKAVCVFYVSVIHDTMIEGMEGQLNLDTRLRFCTHVFFVCKFVGISHLKCSPLVAVNVQSMLGLLVQGLRSVGRHVGDNAFSKSLGIGIAGG